ncbi:MAG: 50S ribosomal protein L27, partial [Lactococcus lactis]|nr:50S ribosomal protein L27 [Lactococcus lactis]
TVKFEMKRGKKHVSVYPVVAK